MKILFIEDNLDDVALITAVLRKEDVEIDFASSFKEGLEKISSFVPDLVVLDLNLPDSGPLLTIQNIKKLDSGRALVIMSGDESSRNILEARNAGASDFIPKSILTNGPELMSRLSKVWFAWASKTSKSADASPLTNLAVKHADVAQSELMLMIRNQNDYQVRWEGVVYKEFKEIKDAILSINTINEGRHQENLGNFKKITDRQDIQNGSLDTLKAKVAFLEKIHKEETDEKIKKAIESNAIIALKDKKILIPKIKLSWRQWSIIGGVLLFFGWQTVFAWMASFWHILLKIGAFFSQA